MKRHRLNVLLLAALLIVLGLEWSFRPDPTRPNFEIMPEMVRAVPAETYAPNPVFASGQTLQEPVPGTIPRGLPPFRFEATRLDALLAGQQLTNPFPPDDEGAARRGAEVYMRFCSTCHGPGGAGDGPVVARGYPAPPTFHAPLSRRMRDGQMYHIITHGRDNMAAFGGRIAREDRWKAILHVRALQAQVEEAEAAAEAEAARLESRAPSPESRAPMEDEP